MHVLRHFIHVLSRGKINIFIFIFIFNMVSSPQRPKAAKEPSQHGALPCMTCWGRGLWFGLWWAGRTACQVVLYRLSWQGAAQLCSSGNPSCCWYLTNCTRNTAITEGRQGTALSLQYYRAGIFKHSVGARNRVGIRLSYQPARLNKLAELMHWNRFLGSLKFKNSGSAPCSSQH